MCCMYKPRARNATYLSPTSQNQIVNVIGHDIIQTSLIAEVKKARFFLPFLLIKCVATM